MATTYTLFKAAAPANEGAHAGNIAVQLDFGVQGAAIGDIFEICALDAGTIIDNICMALATTLYEADGSTPSTATLAISDSATTFISANVPATTGHFSTEAGSGRKCYGSSNTLKATVAADTLGKGKVVIMIQYRTIKAVPENA